MAQHYMAFWNLENLFDLEGITDPQVRPLWLQRALAGELQGWNEQVLEKKVTQLAQIISLMNGGQGPDLLGVCEVENRRVLERLMGKLSGLGRSYAVAHHDASDQRGIDVAFIYDTAKFSAHEQFFHVIQKRTATRDLFQVNFKTASGRLLMVVGNHWPSRSGGQYESEPYRITAAETLSYWASRIADIQGQNAAVLVMGDFNDEPFSRSVTDYGLSGSSRLKVQNAREPRFYNLMWKFHGQAIGTHYFENFPNVLDQFWVSKGLLGSQSPLRVLTDSVAIERFAPMIRTGEYQAPRRFSRPSATDYNPNGYSDHYPISVLMDEQ